MHRWLALTALLALAFVLAGCLPAQPAPAPTTEAAAEPSPSATAPQVASGVAAGFDAARARAHVAYLADPARQGRLTGSSGYADAARYVAEQFRGLGLAPAGDGGTYFQRFGTPVVELTAMPELSITEPDRVPLTPRADFSEVVGATRGGGAAEGRLVYAGGGVDSAAYSDYRGIDPRGKVVLIAGPGQDDPVETALRLGAVGVLLVARQPRGPLLHYSYIPSFREATLPTLVVTESAADRLMASSGKRIADLRSALEERRKSDNAQPLSFVTEVSVRLSVPLGPVRQVEGINVVGSIKPARVDGQTNYLVIGGHLDGVGADPDGTVYPGANDNASGPAVLIEVARVLAAQRDRLRQGVVFVAFAGEEEGSRGAAEFLRRAADAPYRPGSMVGYLNLDVVGCCGETLLAGQDGPGFEGSLAGAARRQGTPLTTARRVSSDNVAFSRQGIPASALLWRDVGPIHTPLDTADAVDVDHLRRLGAVAAEAALGLLLD